MAITLIENFRAVFYAPFYAAAALGAYEAEGLEVEMSTSGAPEETLRALASGEAQVSWGGPLRVMSALERDPASGYVAFCEVVGRDPFFLVGRAPHPRFEPKDLAGRTLAAVAEVPTPWICLQHDLRRAGADPASVRLAPAATMAQNAERLRAGELELIQVFQPYARALVNEGAGHVWYAAASRGPTSYTTLNTTRAFLESRSAAALALARALARTLRWIAVHDGRDLARAIAPYFPGLPGELLAECCEDYRMLGIWNAKPVLSREGFEWLRDAMLAAGWIRRRFAYEDCADMRFAEQVAAEAPPALGDGE
jgi:NitT/TauT family transport system substrate-binding protein